MEAKNAMQPPMGPNRQQGADPLVDISPGHRSRLEVEVVEHLRMRVPPDKRRAWVAAERGSWDPWLREQKGYLGRDIYWDPKQEEGVLLIHWASRAAWDAISQAEVGRVQECFEHLARQALGEPEGNPFPLVHSGCLQPMGWN